MDSKKEAENTSSGNSRVINEKDKGQDKVQADMGVNNAGDPGRTPGSAEGDRKTVEKDLEAKEGRPPEDRHRD